MKKYFFLIIVLIEINQLSFSQDIDIFQKNKNDNFKFEDINPQMSIGEYRILSRSLRMKEMLYAMVMPGYIHFYINKNKYAYSLLALRTIAYGELAYLTKTNKIKLSFIKKPVLSYKKDDIPKTDIYLTYGAIGIVLGTYFYDWIHGQYILQKKQETIRYKYNMKMGLSLISNPNNPPIPGISLNFQF